MTKGFKSTEMWMSVLGAGLVTYMAVSGGSDIAIGALAGLVATYVGGRSFVKGRNGG